VLKLNFLSSNKALRILRGKCSEYEKKKQLLIIALDNRGLSSEPTELNPRDEIERHRSRCQRIVNLQMELAQTYNNFIRLYKDTESLESDFELRQLKFLKVGDLLRDLHLSILEDEDVLHGEAS
jgi:hypothetical protein